MQAAAHIGQGGVRFLIAFTFSGTLLAELEALYGEGCAVTVDLRSAEHDGAHYKGEVADIIDLHMWEIVFFVGPNCYQHMRRDTCLDRKKGDGRAYWAGAMVLWCLTCPYALAVIVEQPDSIVYDYVDFEGLPDVHLVETRTSWHGDSSDKFMRLALRNASMAEPGPPTALEYSTRRR